MEQDKSSDLLVNKKEEPKINATGESSIYFLVKHAERNDSTSRGEQTTLKNDPAITDYGKNQAMESAREIKKMIQKYKKEGVFGKNAKIVVLTSPYLRCIQTAYHIAQYFSRGLKDENIYIEDGLIEWAKDFNHMIGETYTKLICDRKKSDNMDKMTENQIFQRNQIFNYEEFICLNRSCYESDKQIRNRYLAICENVDRLAIENKSKTIYICVVHSTMTEWMMRTLESDKLEKS